MHPAIIFLEKLIWGGGPDQITPYFCQQKPSPKPLLLGQKE